MNNTRELRRMGHPISPKKQGRKRSILQLADKKPYISIGESISLPRCTVVADHDDPSTGGALSDPDYAERLYNPSDRVCP